MTDRLWAPWRMEYILGQKPSACFFCEHVTTGHEAHRERLVLLVHKHAHVCLNRYPFAAAHIMVAPNRHVSDLSLLDAHEYADLMGLVRLSADSLRKATRCEGINIGFNLGKAAGAGVEEHLHGHLVPRWAGDHNFMPVIGGVRVMPDYLDETWARLHPFFAGAQGVDP
jgi:ATP adenylyltransferase